jgi:predicted methyltransferase
MDIIQFILDQLDKPVKKFMFRFNLDNWSCRHCEGTGVCLNGWKNLGDKYSCKTCIKAFDEKEFSSQVRVKCSICNGTGREQEYLKMKQIEAKDG